MASAHASRPSLLPLVACLAAALGAPAMAQNGLEDCPAGMVLVEGGTLKARGADGFRVPSFCLDRTEVTVNAYAACVEIGACDASGLACGAAATWGKKNHGAHPVNCVTWAEADKYCREHGLRLPLEEEWEWAARGGERALTYPWGKTPPANRACWDGDGNAKGKGERKGACPVASHPRGRSPLGIEDLSGNVREWTSSEHERFRVLRGGSWGDDRPDFLAASFRGWNAPDERMELLGFRCAAAVGTVAREPPPPPEAARASTDDAGVMIFSEPIELGPKSERPKPPVRKKRR
jgi:formylglycine-generating enzyme required for sulfatase activity